MRRPIVRRAVRQTKGRRVVRVKTLPPPVGGWNARDSLALMPQRDAVVLDDMFPEQSSVRLRPGYDEHCDTGEAGEDIGVIIPFRNGSTSKLIASVNGKFFDVTTSTPSSLATGLTNDDWSHAFLGEKVIMCNGADVVKSYDGSAIASPAFTGPTLTTLNQVCAYKSRLYFVQKESKSMWYGGVGAITSTLTEFDFSTVLSVDGNLKIVCRLSGDGGDGGADDLLAAIFEDGSVAVYTGSDPGDANNWALVGVYKIGEPLSRLGHIEIANDVYIITSRGYESIRRVMGLGDSTGNSKLLSDKIQGIVAESVRAGGVSDKWRMHIYPNGQMMFVTVPYSGSRRTQHVRNINTGAWCRFSIQALCWAQLGQDCYFGGSDGTIYQFSPEFTSDNGSIITGVAQPAWSYLDYPGLQKETKMVRPFFLAETFPSTAVSIEADFDTISTGEFEAAGTAPNQAVWDVAVWDSATWSVPQEAQSRWLTRPAVGDAIGVKITVQTSTLNIDWNAWQIAYVLGGPV